MSKKQVIFASLLVALPAIGLLMALVFGAINHRGNMFSGLMTVIVAVSGLLVLALGLSPFALMAFYPAEGFASFGPAGGAPQPASRPATEGEEDEDAAGFEDDGGADDEFADDDGFADDAGDDDELFDSDGEEFDDDDEWE